MRMKKLFFKILCVIMVITLFSALPVWASEDFPLDDVIVPGPDQIMLTIMVDGERVTNVDKNLVLLGSVCADYIENGSYWFNFVKPDTYSVFLPGFDTDGIKVTKPEDEGVSLELSYRSLNNSNTTITLAGDVLIRDGAEKVQKIASVKVAGISKPLVEGVDYYIADNSDRATDAGAYQLKICGKGKFCGEATCNWVIAKGDVDLPKQFNAKVNVEINKEKGVPKVALNTSADELPAAILCADTAADLISEGGTLEVQIGTVDVASQKELADFADGWTVGQSFSVGLVFTGAESGKSNDIKETRTHLSFKITLPDDIKGKSERSFGVVRSHEVDAHKKDYDFLDNTSYNPEDGIMVFKNDKYSDFAIVYKDKEAVPSAYTVTEGEGQTYTISSGKTLSFACDGAFDKFTGIKIDGQTVAAENYTAVSGSTLITLKSEYLDTLSDGNHTIQFIYEDGESNIAEFAVQEAATKPITPQKEEDNADVKPDTERPVSAKAMSPQTGDRSHLVLLAALLGLSGLALVTNKLYCRKNKSAK